MVLHIIPSLSLKSGGPKKSLENLLSIRKKDHVYSLKGDGHIASGEVISLIMALRGLFCSSYTALHIHSIWNPVLVIFVLFASLCGTKVVVSPRGMLEPWVLKKSRIIKKIALFSYVRFMFNMTDVIVASSKQEKLGIRRLFCGAKVEVISNGYVGAFYEGRRNFNDELVLIYFGRIDEKKGIDVLLDSVKGLHIGYKLIIVGCEGYDCENFCDKELEVDLYPFMAYEELKDLLLRSHVFVFPTRSENFGNTILEALAHGLFVVTTKESSWWELDKSKGGTIVECDSDSVKEAIMDYHFLSEAEKMKLSKNASQYAKSHHMKNLIPYWCAIYE